MRSRYDLSSLETAVHAAAPCPVPVKQQMIDWWGPVLLEYYASTEAVGFSACDSAEWLAHPGTVGKVVLGELHILDESLQPVPPGTPGTLWFRPGSPFRYFDDVEKTAESTSPDGSMVTVGDVGYLDDDGYLYLTDRATFMIISGGVNIYPQECENLLITHPKVADAAVFGVPNEDLGEEVKAVVQLMPGSDPGPGHRRRADRVLPRAPRPPQMPPVGRLHQPAAPAPDRQALQKGPPGQLLGPIPQPHRVTAPPAPCQDSRCHQLLNHGPRGQVIHAIPASSPAAMSSYRPRNHGSQRLKLPATRHPVMLRRHHRDPELRVMHRGRVPQRQCQGRGDVQDWESLEEGLHATGVTAEEIQAGARRLLAENRAHQLAETRKQLGLAQKDMAAALG